MVVESGPPQFRPFIDLTLKRWKVDSDLVDIRDEAALAKLPEAERESFRALWSDVETLRKKAKAGRPQ